MFCIKGGAIATDATSHVDIEYSSFTKNQGGDGGALFLAEYGVLSVSRSVFEENFSLLGGAIFTSGVTTVDESTFTDNLGIEGVSKNRIRALFDGRLYIPTG